MTILFQDLGVCYGEFGRAEGRTADPSTALRSGPTAGRDRRDDKGESGALKDRLLGAGGDLLFWGPETVSHYFACSREKKLFT
jgi:hypothetical protein